MISPEDRNLLRDLAREVADIAALPIQADRRRRWAEHNALRSTTPLVYVSPEGSWRELLPDATLQCSPGPARGAEKSLRMRIYAHQHFNHDVPVDPVWVVEKSVWHTGWGLEARRIPSPTAHGAWKHEPVLLQPTDVKKLRLPELQVDEEASRRRLETAQELLGDILDVRQVGIHRISYHLMKQYSDWRGLEQTYMDMVDEPELLHDVLSFLLEGHRKLLQQWQDANLLSLNNDGTYHSSGGLGYTDELPAEGLDPERVRPCDMWASAEVQELAAVGPAQHVEFAIDYEKKLLAPFGLNGYGCCEDLTRKLDDVLTLPNIRRISISPWADVEKCAQKLQDKYIYSWKPQPAMLAGEFNEQRVRSYLRHALEATRGCVLEIILKDTHTCDNHPNRFDRWTKICREEVDQAAASVE